MSLSMQPKPYSPGKALARSQAPQDNATVKKAHPFSSNAQSPYTHSPNPLYSKLNYSLSASNDELEMYKGRCYDLERELAQIRSDVDLQRLLHLKSSDLEQKVAEVLEHNHALQGQLERASKQTLQRKTEGEMWKQKYETQMQQLIQIKGNYELEIKALSQEIQKVNAKIGSQEYEKNRTISDQKVINDCRVQQNSETFKKSQGLQNEMFEGQVRKMRDIIEDKSVQVNQLQTALERQRAESSDIQARYRNEVEGLKSRLSSIQIDHQSELQALKNKLELYKETQVRNAQFAHDNQTDILLTEIEKLKHLMEIKNEEIETLIVQNQKQKGQHELECDGLRYEIEELKRRFLENEQTHQQENHNIQLNLECMHNNEVISLKLQHEQQIQALNREILKLKEMIDSKNGEIEKQMLEKAQQKDYYDGEIHRLINTVEDWKRKCSLLESERNREVSDLLGRIERINQQHEQVVYDLQNQIDLLNGELNNLKNLIEHKNAEIEQNLINHSQVKLDLEEKVRIVQTDLENVKLRLFETEKSKNQEIQDLKLLLKEQDVIYRERLRQFEIQIDHLKYELTKANDMFNNKARECDNLNTQRNNFELAARKLQDENDALIQKLHDFERIKNIEIDELRQKMDHGAAYQFENLKSAYNTQVGILSDQIADLQNQLAIKHRDNTELIEKYAILDRSVLPDPLVRSNMYNSRTGVPAEYIVNKSVHDAALRQHLRNSSIHRQ